VFLTASLAIVMNAVYRDPGTVMRGVGAISPAASRCIGG
jgi:hypothetical protein